jgi:hypothetical protein
VLETYRECLQDVFDLPSLKRLLQGCGPAARPRRRRDAVASPYAASLLFDYVATYMYEDDTPPAERRAQALSLDRELLRSCSARRSCASCSTRRGRRGRGQLRGDPRIPTSCTTCCGCAATSARRVRRGAGGRARAERRALRVRSPARSG